MVYHIEIKVLWFFRFSTFSALKKKGHFACSAHAIFFILRALSLRTYCKKEYNMYTRIICYIGMCGVCFVVCVWCIQWANSVYTFCKWTFWISRLVILFLNCTRMRFECARRRRASNPVQYLMPVCTPPQPPPPQSNTHFPYSEEHHQTRTEGKPILHSCTLICFLFHFAHWLVPITPQNNEFMRNFH